MLREPRTCTKAHEWGCLMDTLEGKGIEVKEALAKQVHTFSVPSSASLVKMSAFMSAL